jgi:hypothetical protein
MSEEKTVHVKLVFDSNAKEAGKKNEEELDKSGKKAAKSWKENLGEGFSGAGSMMAGAAVAGAAAFGAAVAGLGAASFHAFAESESQVRQLASTFAMLGDGTQSMEQLHAVAGGVKDELEGIGMAAGESDDAMVAVFQNLIEHGDRSVESAQRLTQEMAYAGRAIPGGAEALSSAFEQVEMGMIRARNPLVQMISATGLLHGNAKSVASQMQKMSVAEQMALAEKAVGKMSENMKKVPMTFEQLKTSMSVFGGNLLEAAGKPLYESATKYMGKLRAIFMNEDGSPTAFGEKFSAAADSFGNRLAVAFDVGWDFLSGFVDGFDDWSEEMKFMFKEMFGESDDSLASWKDTAKQIGHILGEGVGAVVVGLTAVYLAVEKSVKYLVWGAGKVTKALGDATGSKETSKAGTSMIHAALAGENTDLLKHAAQTQGGNQDAIKAQYLKNAADMGANIEQAGDDIAAAFAERARVQHDVDLAAQAATTQSLDGFAAAFNDAAKAHDQGAMNQIAAIMRGASGIKDALTVAGPQMLGEGAEAFIAALKNVGEDGLAKTLKGGLKADTAHLKASPTHVTQNFSGGIQIKQDFKDADPDRILVAFTDRLASVASSRLQPRGALPFSR